MKTILALSVVLWVTAILTAPASADIIVLNNGQYGIGRVSTAASGRLQLTTEYGDQFFSRDQVAGYYLTPKGMEAEGFYQAGFLLLSKGQPESARKLFEACVGYDATYRDKCNTALRGGPSAVPPTTPPPAGTPGEVPATAPPAQPQTQVVTIQCSNCSGGGVVMGSSVLGGGDRGGGTDRPRPCPICGGKGYKIMTIPPGYEICSDCGGFGATSGGGGRSDTSGLTRTKQICPRCAGRGIIRSPWKPPEETPGTGPSAVMMTAPGPSPSPGAPPHGAASIIRERAKSVASGEQPTRPIGPASVRPVSPTILEESSSGQGEGSVSRTESGDEIIEEEGTSSEGATEEASKTSVSEEESESAPQYTQPGLSGWIGRHKWYVVLGGVALLVFVIVFNKMSAKK